MGRPLFTRAEGERLADDLREAQADRDKYRALAKRLSDALLAVRPLGGSEMFTRVGDEYFADPDYCKSIIEWLHNSRHELMKRAVRQSKDS